jgi:cytochrome oxidase assembly protein ShyY1
MRRLPVIPTILVAGAVAVMIALGIWQLQRAEWKDRLVAQYAEASALPTLDLDPLLARDPTMLPPLGFRRVLVTCNAANVEPVLRGGRSADGRGGYSYFVPCRPGAGGLASRIIVNAGWSALPEHGRRLSIGGIVAGRLGAERDDGETIILTSATAAPRLSPSAPPTIDDIPRNHRAYAVQWFAFALIALVIYLIALRARRRPQLPPEP